VEKGSKIKGEIMGECILIFLFLILYGEMTVRSGKKYGSPTSRIWVFWPVTRPIAAFIKWIEESGVID
jgi:hypothetical protein